MLEKNDIYIISAMKLCWNSLNRGELDMNIFQSLDIIKTDENEDNIIQTSTHPKVDSTTVYLDEIKPERYTNTNVVAVCFRHLHGMKRKDNYTVKIYIK